MMIGRIPLRVISAARKASVTRANAGNDVAMPYRGTATRNNIADARCANGFLSSRRFASTDKDGKSNDGSSSSRAPLKPKESQTDGSSLRVDQNLSGGKMNMGNNKQGVGRNANNGEGRHYHSEFPTAVKPDPARMWNAVGQNPDYEVASSDSGGYLRRVDFGLNDAEVDEACREMNEEDERLKSSHQSSSGPNTAIGASNPQEKPDDSSRMSRAKDQRKAKNHDQPSEKAETSELQGGEMITPDQDNRPDLKRTVSNAQQSVVWEGTSMSTSGSDDSGISQLTEQLMDREAARSGLEAEKSVSTQTVGTTSKKGSKKKSDKDEDTSSSSSSSDSESDSEERKREMKLQKRKKQES